MGSGSAWTARVLGATTSSSSGSGDRSSTRRSTSELTAPSPRPVLRSAGISTSTTHADRIRALTGGRRIEPTSPSCRRSRRPEPGRPSTYQSGKPVPTNRASSDHAVVLTPNYQAAATLSLDRCGVSGVPLLQDWDLDLDLVRAALRPTHD